MARDMARDFCVCDPEDIELYVALTAGPDQSLRVSFAIGDSPAATARRQREAMPAAIAYLTPEQARQLRDYLITVTEELRR